MIDIYDEGIEGRLLYARDHLEKLYREKIRKKILYNKKYEDDKIADEKERKKIAIAEKKFQANKKKEEE